MGKVGESEVGFVQGIPNQTGRSLPRALEEGRQWKGVKLGDKTHGDNVAGALGQSSHLGGSALAQDKLPVLEEDLTQSEGCFVLERL